MEEFDMENHNNWLAFQERAIGLRDRISSLIKNRDLYMSESEASWPEAGSRLRLARKDSRGWVEIESQPYRSEYCLGRSIVVTSNMEDEKHVFAVDRSNVEGWLLLPLHKYGIAFDKIRDGYPILEVIDSVKPLIEQVFGIDLQGIKKAAEA